MFKESSLISITKLITFLSFKISFALYPDPLRNSFLSINRIKLQLKDDLSQIMVLVHCFKIQSKVYIFIV
jgi:hypothetical protein